MKIPKFARYDYCCKKATEFLIEENIITLPFDADKIIKKHKWAKLKYSELASKHNTSIANIIETYNSEDGYTIFNGRNYTISYNDTCPVKQRIYFTKLHEIGHIYLNHFIDFEATILNRSALTNEEYKVLENEANCFARNVLSPIVLVDQLALNKHQIVDIFDITDSAAKTRFALKKSDLYWISPDDYNLLLNHFESFIYNAKNTYHCSTCQTSFVAESAKYCPICGYNTIKKCKIYVRSEFDMIYNDGFELDENGKAKICPKCGNEQMFDDGTNCRICGTYLINRCSNVYGYEDGNGEWIDACGKIAAGNARYCEYCGCTTTFYDQNLLKDWRKAKADIEVAAAKEDGSFYIIEDNDSDNNSNNVPF